MIKYSVLMSVFKNDNPVFLRQAIDSMLNQTIRCSQFVVVEDGPITAELQMVIDDYVKTDKKLLTIVKLKENVGLGRALDMGLEYCENELVARMDADDISKPDRCERMLREFEKDGRLCLLGTNVDEFYLSQDNIITSRKVPTEFKDIKKFARRRNPFNHPTVMFKKSEVRRCGGYGDLKRRQDYDLWSRMLNMGCLARNIDESLLLFRTDENYQKRRKNWVNCKSTIVVAKRNYKRGYCSITDLLYITAGQLFLHFSPSWLTKKISNKYLRERRK